MFHKQFRCLVAVSAVMLSVSTLSRAQTITGSVNGTVTDPSGAVIPNATIAAHNVDTGVDTKTTSNNTGDYNIRFLQIGHYTVTVSGAGFSTYTSPQFTLEVNQIAKIDAKLAPGNESQADNSSRFWIPPTHPFPAPLPRTQFRICR
jgi:hypothetical protein